MPTMKYVMILLLVVIADGGRLIKGKAFEGYIFPENHFVMIPSEGGRFTPQTADVLKAEAILKRKIEELNHEKINQANGAPLIHKKLHKFVRQYVGIINNKGQHIIWINCIWKHDANKTELIKDIISVLDGGSYYWNVKVNLDTETLYDLDVNGFA